MRCTPASARRPGATPPPREALAEHAGTSGIDLRPVELDVTDSGLLSLSNPTASHHNEGEVMPFANLKVPAGLVDEAQKHDLVTQVTDMYARLFGERARATTMVLVDEVVDGGWGIGGEVLTKAILTGETPAAPAVGPDAASTAAESWLGRVDDGAEAGGTAG
jgi:4-oxalocrotonate tautomerase